MLIKLREKAQSTTEYVMLFALVLGAFALVNTNIKRRLAFYVDDKVQKTLNLATADMAKDRSAISRASKEQENTLQTTATPQGDGLYKDGQGSESRRVVIAGTAADPIIAAQVNGMPDITTPWATSTDLEDRTQTNMGNGGVISPQEGN